MTCTCQICVYISIPSVSVCIRFKLHVKNKEGWRELRGARARDTNHDALHLPGVFRHCPAILFQPSGSLSAEAKEHKKVIITPHKFKANSYCLRERRAYEVF
jgi:hypothetical protein